MCIRRHPSASFVLRGNSQVFLNSELYQSVMSSGKTHFPTIKYDNDSDQTRHFIQTNSEILILDRWFLADQHGYRHGADQICGGSAGAVGCGTDGGLLKFKTSTSGGGP